MKTQIWWLPSVTLCRIFARNMVLGKATPEEVYEGMRKRLNLERFDRATLDEEDRAKYDELVEWLRGLEVD